MSSDGEELLMPLGISKRNKPQLSISSDFGRGGGGGGAGRGGGNA